MSLKSNFEYIRDWCNFRFLKKDDQLKVDLSNYPTKDEVDDALNESGAWVVEDPSSSYSGVKTKNGNNSVYNSYAVAEGYNTTAGSSYSHAEGHTTSTWGDSSHAEGYYTNASGNYSHAEGYYTNTRNKGEHAGGNYNSSYRNSSTFGDSLNTTFSHGIGTNYYDTKNAIEIMENGDCYIYGLGGYNGKNASSASTLQNVLTNVISQDQYADDEEVIAAALNDLNSRILSLNEMANTLITIVIDGSVNINTGDVTSYVNASTTEEQRFLLMNHLDTKIRIIDEETGFNRTFHYGTYNGYTGYFGFDNGGPVRFYYDSANDKYIANWYILAS